MSSQQINLILKDYWYKTATPRQMRVALMHLQQESMDRLYNTLARSYNEKRDESFDELCDAAEWNNVPYVKETDA
jgi:hypothetical protein